MFCEKCGNSVAEGMKFCKKCGNPVAAGNRSASSGGGYAGSAPSFNPNPTSGGYAGSAPSFNPNPTPGGYADPAPSFNPNPTSGGYAGSAPSFNPNPAPSGYADPASYAYTNYSAAATASSRKSKKGLIIVVISALVIIGAVVAGIILIFGGSGNFRDDLVGTWTNKGKREYVFHDSGLAEYHKGSQSYKYDWDVYSFDIKGDDEAVFECSEGKQELTLWEETDEEYDGLIELLENKGGREKNYWYLFKFNGDDKVELTYCYPDTEGGVHYLVLKDGETYYRED